MRCPLRRLPLLYSPVAPDDVTSRPPFSFLFFAAAAAALPGHQLSTASAATMKPRDRQTHHGREDQRTELTRTGPEVGVERATVKQFDPFPTTVHNVTRM